MHHDSAARRTEDAGAIGRLLRTSVKHCITKKSVTNHAPRCVNHQQQHSQGRHSASLQWSVWISQNALFSQCLQQCQALLEIYGPSYLQCASSRPPVINLGT